MVIIEKMKKEILTKHIGIMIDGIRRWAREK
jgi:undecaprenyl pyrophosphate synthase